MQRDRWSIERWMSREVRTVTTEDRLVDAYELMRLHRIRHVPVLDEKGALVGILSDRDVRHAIPIEARDGGSRSPYGRKLMTTPVASVMTRHPLRAAADESVRDAAELLCREKIGALPVVDESGTLKGIISVEDVLWAFLENTADDDAAAAAGAIAAREREARETAAKGGRKAG